MRNSGIIRLRIWAIALVALLLLSACGCATGKKIENYVNDVNDADLKLGADMSFVRSQDLDFSGIEFTPWAVTGVNKRNGKPYTVMVYMNGSDLESDSGAATDDIIEMLNAQIDPDLVSLVIFTGGTNYWRNNVVPSNDCVIYEISDGYISKVTSVGLRSMGDPGTLSSFIDFSVTYFPAEKYGLIMWDHGGGSIAGFGHDEKFANGTLTLMKLNYAFEMSQLKDEPLEFLGFDSCLMATVETAEVASRYAKYLIASEDLEPGDGWDYAFLSELSENPRMNGEALGIFIAEYYMSYYKGADVDLTLSVVDLKKVGNVLYALGVLMGKCSNSLALEREESFLTLSKARLNTKTFGQGSARDNQIDMVDIGDMATKLAAYYSYESQLIFAALKEAVKYNRHNYSFYLSGLSAYYVYGGKSTAQQSLKIYESLKMQPDYTGYLYRFYSLLSGFAVKSRSRSAVSLINEEIVRRELLLYNRIDDKTFSIVGCKELTDTKDDGLWHAINGQYVCLKKISESGERRLYTVPARINGEDMGIVILFCERYQNGIILGARKEYGFVIQKGYDEIKDGDTVAFYYCTRTMNDKESLNADNEKNWVLGAEFTVKDSLSLEQINANGLPTGVRLYDARLNEYYDDPK